MTDFSKAVNAYSCGSNSSLGQCLKLAWEDVFKPSSVPLWWFYNSLHMENQRMHFPHAEAAFYTLRDYSGRRWLVKDRRSEEERYFNNILILIWSQHVAVMIFCPQSILAMNIFLVC